MRFPCALQTDVLSIQKVCVPLLPNKEHLIQTYLFQKRYAFLVIEKPEKFFKHNKIERSGFHVLRGLLFSYLLCAGNLRTFRLQCGAYQFHVSFFYKSLEELKETIQIYYEKDIFFLALWSNVIRVYSL